MKKTHDIGLTHTILLRNNLLKNHFLNRKQSRYYLKDKVDDSITISQMITGF